MPIIRLLLISLFSSVFLSCSSQPAKPEGEWKLAKMKILNPRNNKVLMLDLSNIDKSRKDMHQFLSDNFIDEGGFEPNTERTAQMIASLQKATLRLSENETFTMAGYGSICSSVPGWNFGDTVSGRWSKQGHVLSLKVGNDERNYVFKYEVVDVTSRSLILKEVLPDGGFGPEYHFVR